MKCQSLFSRKNKTTIVNWSSAELAQRVVKVKDKKMNAIKSYLETIKLVMNNIM